jgi:hypothetical protein
MFDHLGTTAMRGSILVAAVAAAAIAAPTLAAASDLTGSWVVHAEWGPKFKYDLLCGLRQQGEPVAGPCMALAVEPVKAGGILDKDRLELEYLTDYQGYDVAVHFHGVIAGDGTVKGTVESGQSSGGFSGVRIGDAGPLANWKLHVAVGNFDFQMLCAMSLKGKLLRGPCAAGAGVVLSAAGTSDDKTVTLAYDTYVAGKPLHVVYTGALQPDGSIKGAATDGTNSGVFTAKRR